MRASRIALGGRSLRIIRLGFPAPAPNPTAAFAYHSRLCSISLNWPHSVAGQTSD